MGDRSLAADPPLPDGLATPPGSEVTATARDGARLHGFRAGSTAGQPVLLVHGIAVDGGFWAPVTTRLADAGFDVVAIDQRGHGRSERGAAAWSGDTLVADLEAWIEQLGLRDVVVVAHSMGCVAGMLHAIRESRSEEAPTKAVLLSGAQARPAPVGPFGTRLTSLMTHPVLLRRRSLGKFLLGLIDDTSDPDGPFREMVRASFLRFDRRTFAESNQLIQSFDLSAQLPSVTLPIHVVAGENDRLVPVSRQRELADLVPGSSFTLLRGCGHQVMFDAPDELSRLIADM